MSAETNFFPRPRLHYALAPHPGAVVGAVTAPTKDTKPRPKPDLSSTQVPCSATCTRELCSDGWRRGPALVRAAARAPVVLLGDLLCSRPEIELNSRHVYQMGAFASKPRDAGLR